jgi:hypothetical protein
MKGVVIVDGTVPAGHEVTMGPGATRACAYPPCGHRLAVDAPPNQRYHHSKCRTADWKARKGSQTTAGTVQAVRSWVEPGDAQNAGSAGLSKRAAELREARQRGTVASDLRLQYARAVEVLAEYLRLLNIPAPERKAHEVMSRALPKGRRA